MRTTAIGTNCPAVSYFSDGVFKITPFDFPSSCSRTDRARPSINPFRSCAGRLMPNLFSPGEGAIGFNPTDWSNLCSLNADSAPTGSRISAGDAVSAGGIDCSRSDSASRP